MKPVVLKSAAMCGLVMAMWSMSLSAQSDAVRDSTRQSTSDAWWTGPILAAGAGTLPPGHWLIEPYVYDVMSTNTNAFGSRTYVLYGLVPRFTVGFIPIFGYNRLSKAPSSSSPELGDVIAQAAYRLTLFHPGGWVPTSSIVVQEQLPTGRYDRLGDKPSDGQGEGVYTTTVGLYSQFLLWMPNGRILRTRVNVSGSFSTSASVDGVSVYGTSGTFTGHARPGTSLFVNPAWEYSLTRSWVLALDAFYTHGGNTRVAGTDMLGPVLVNSQTSDSFGTAPALEYNWNSSMGVIVGARLIAKGHNAGSSVTPVFAINMVY